jgi:heavy metal sensor kinase
VASFSIRLRLTFWYSAVLLAGMALFAVSSWVSLRHVLLSSLRAEAERISLGAMSIVREEGLEGAPIPEFRASLESFAASAKDARIEVRSADGALIFPEFPARPRSGVVTARNTAVVRGREYSVVASVSRAEVDSLLWSFILVLFGGLPLTLLAAAFGGYWISRRALAPVDAMTEAARSIGVRNLSQRLATPGTGDELQRLAETWNKMLDRLESAVNRLAQFTADASHELRTPVALIRTTAELTLRRRRTTEEYCEALTEIQAESERTSELIADLLTLARADAGQGSLPLEPADLAPLVEEACRQGRLLAGAKQVRLEASAPEEAVFVDANPPALRRLLLILLDNAVKYTPRGGTVRISVSAGPPAAITVTDTGTGIPEKELSRIFERFYRADPSRNRETGGSGLGLSIAQWIAEMHGAEIGAESAEGQGSEFRVRFSRSSA